MTSDDSTRQPDDEAPPAAGRREIPEPPDMAKVNDLRRRLQAERSAGGGGSRVRRSGQGGDDLGSRARDIGMYTIIPMMMVVGPALGYLLGLFIENRFGGKPWPTVVGVLWGLAAAFRQIYLLLKRKSGDGRGAGDR